MSLANDITLCPGGECPLRAGCLRFRAIGYGRFDSFGAPPFNESRGSCDSFMALPASTPSEDQIRLRAYLLWQSAGRPQGQADAHWAQAKAELTQQIAAALDKGLRAP